MKFFLFHANLNSFCDHEILRCCIQRLLPLWMLQKKNAKLTEYFGQLFMQARIVREGHEKLHLIVVSI